VQVCKNEAGSKLDKHVNEVLNLMKSRGDGHLIGGLEAAVAQAYAVEVEGSDIKVTTAGDPSKMKSLVASILKVHEEDIEATQDDDLIGGAVIKVDNTIIDASIKGRLHQLASHLTK
jgi:F0F1-type ATP synthase delta subunit